MPHLFPGFSGMVVSLFTPAGLFIAVFRSTKNGAFEFDAKGEKGSFEKLLPVYLRVAEVVIGLAAGSIVLLVGSSAFHQNARLPWFFASPLSLLAASIIYGILFMVFLIRDYETYRAANGSHSYTRFKYTRNQTFGYSGLLCFCVGYAWLIVSVMK
jgi:hypothetical protein